MQNENSKNRIRAEEVLKSGFVTEPTRQALEARLQEKTGFSFFDNHSFKVLSRICDLLMDQDSDNQMVDVALYIDQRLSNNQSDGWRYDSMPPDQIAFKIALKNIDQTSTELFDLNFPELKPQQQIEILNAVQKGDVSEEIWYRVDAKLFFEELLAEAAEIFFSDPAVQSSINYVGMADAKGWTKIKLGQSENLEGSRQNFN